MGHRQRGQHTVERNANERQEQDSPDCRRARVHRCDQPGLHHREHRRSPLTDRIQTERSAAAREAMTGPPLTGGPTSPGQMPRLTVAVVSWNSARDIAGLLASLAGGLMGVPSWELILADNNSTDETVGVVKQLSPNATVVRLERNLGYAAGINAAIAASAPTHAVVT